MKNDFDKQLGETLRTIREEKNISAAEIADRMNVTKQAVSYWELGDRQMKAATLRDYCAVIGVTMQYVFDRMDGIEQWTP